MRNGITTFFNPGYILLLTFAILLNLILFSLEEGAAQNPSKKSSKSTLKTTSQKLLSNQDIIKLVKAEMEEDIIIAKINQEKEVGFSLDPDSLINLKQNGVSKNIISAMLNKASPGSKDSKALSSPGAGGAAAEKATNKSTASQAVSMVDKLVGQNVSTVKLLCKNGEIDLEGKVGRAQFSIFKAEANYPGLKAKTRITDRNPSFLISLPHEPQGQAFIVRLEQEPNDNIRIMSCGKTLFRFSTKGLGLPEENLRIPYGVKTEGKDIYRLSIKNDLESGEYGVYVLAASGIEAGMLYDFGVD